MVFAACLLPAADLAWRAVHPEGLGVNPIEEAEIFTGLWTLRFLAITLAVTPARQLFRLGFLARYRRMFGLFTFFYACVHLSMWVGVDWFFAWGLMGGEIVKHKYILVGMASFLLLLPLALTSTNRAMRWLGGRRWRRLHQAVYLVAIGGTVHYLWAVKKDTFFPLVYLAVFVALLAYRVVARWTARRAPSATPSSRAAESALQRSA
ncbi:MAG TPA: protein-methionine-sulfoxide reductase heme-binding subunit MsrQ [Gemmatimonadaceae bacterium]|nr:protein-methionine-sulfoxide reductase heme-binding subunit MsrQ [Gemmatimonadaceae bacterium]